MAQRQLQAATREAARKESQESSVGEVYSRRNKGGRKGKEGGNKGAGDGLAQDGGNQRGAVVQGELQRTVSELHSKIAVLEGFMRRCFTR